MSLITRIRYLHSAYFSKPAAYRPLFRAVRRHHVCRIVEIGLGDLQRGLRLIRLAGRLGGDPSAIRYTGIDLFEARPAPSEPLPLKRAHQLLTATGARIKLVPGDPFQGLHQAANSLLGTDLLILSAEIDQIAMESAWFYVPRLLHDGSAVFQEHKPAGEETRYQPVPPDDIAARAKSNHRRRAA